MSILRIFETSKRSLLSHQSAINTTANNIANVYAEGYNRRSVDLSKLSLGFGNMSESSVIRVKNSFLDNQIWFENQALGKQSVSEMLLNQVESVFGEPGDSGLSNILNEFWNSWTNLSNNPESDSARSLVRDKGELLSNTFNRLDKNLKNLQTQSANELQHKVNEINQLVNQLGTVNSKIDIHRSDDLLDQRDILIMELSQKIDVHITETETGRVEVLSGGHILVSEDFVNQLKLKLSQKQNGTFKAEIKTIQGDKNLSIKSGEIGGLLEFHNDHISRFIQSIDKLAVSLANAINEFHVEGYNLKGLSGWNFFNESVSGAGDISLTPEILSDASLISTSSDSSAQGNGSVAQSIADLQYDGIIEEKTISDQYNTIIADVGNRVQESTFIRQNQEKIVSQLHIKKASISGVSLDEEMTQLIQYEQAYEASARMISTIDELMQTILSMG